ncbi:AAA family ATPase [Paeniglutamicibacter gangotriensis]|uniref:AAA family ATPase n=1 Tax=Paeniglutamicibacter gangotriensis TaxID=254787 RepID=UPI0037CC10D2
MLSFSRKTTASNQGRFKHLTDNLNNEITRWNDAVATKKASLYAPITVDFELAGELVRDLQQALKTIEQTRLDWNDGIKGIKQLLSQTLVLNNDVSRLEVEARIENYRSALASLQSAEATLAEQSEALDKLDTQVRDLRSALRDEDVAADDVNRGLATVFADSNRLRIVVADETQSGGRFMLQSRGRYLKPHRLSVGERNVLSLCYFFTLLRQCINDGLDLNKSLIVLDDPISSVDIDCRIGILSYLESQLKELLTDSSSAKTLFLTHDVGIFQDLGKTSKAVIESLEPPSQGAWETAPWVLRNVGSEESVRVSLVKHSGGFDEPLHEYKTLLGFVFQYAVDGASPQENDVASIGIGNALRRVYEAFGVFIYGQKSITSLRVVEAYESLGRGPLGQPIRHALVTVLHGGSHNKDRMMMLSDFGMGASVDPAERVVVVRRVLALMHAVQPIHMRHYLSDEATTILEEWEESYLLVADSQQITLHK